MARSLILAAVLGGAAAFSASGEPENYFDACPTREVDDYPWDEYLKGKVEVFETKCGTPATALTDYDADYKSCFECGEIPGDEPDFPKCASGCTSKVESASETYFEGCPSDSCETAIRDLIHDRCFFRYYYNQTENFDIWVDTAMEECLSVKWGSIFLTLGVATVGSMVMLLGSGYLMTWGMNWKHKRNAELQPLSQEES